MLSPVVSGALAAGRPVDALESTLLAHGLPRPENRQAADEVEAEVQAEMARRFPGLLERAVTTASPQAG